MKTKTFDFGGERYLKTGKTLEKKNIEELRKYSSPFFRGGHWASGSKAGDFKDRGLAETALFLRPVYQSASGKAV